MVLLLVVVCELIPDYSITLKSVGDMFIRMIKMIVVPLIFSSLIVGIVGTIDLKKIWVGLE